MARDFEKNDNDYIDAGNPSSINLTGDKVTLSAWIKLESASEEGKILAKWSDAGGEFQYLISSDGGDKCLFAVKASSQDSVVGTTTLTVGDWIHIAGVYDGSKIRVYCEGVEENSKSLSGNMSSTTAPLRVGAGSGGTGTENPFDGVIGHCAIWDVGLTGDEVKSLASGINPMQIRPNDLVFYAPLNGQNPEYDIIEGLDLTVVGATKSEEPPIPNSIKAS